MIRRIAALLLALGLLMGAALGEQTMQTYDNLTDKLYRQLQLSPLRGVVRFTLEGDAPWAEPFRPLSGAQIKFRSGANQNGRREIQTYITKDGVDTCRVLLWGDGRDLYLSSDLLIDTVVRYPWRGDYYSSLTARGNENPNYLSAVVNALLHSDDWTELVEPLRTEVENWLMGFAGTPEQMEDEGRSVISIRYRISAAAVKNEMKQLLRMALENRELELQMNLYLSEEQRALGFSNVNLDYEDRVIDTLPLEEDVIIERRVTGMGEVVSTAMTLPLTSNPMGWTSLDVTEADGEISLELQGGSRPMALTFSTREQGRETTAWQGTLDMVTSDGKLLRTTWSADRTFTELRDENYVQHEVTVLNLRAEAAEGSEITFDPITANLNLHMYSGYGQTAFVTLEATGTAEILGERITLAAKITDVEVWEIREIEIDGAVDALTLSEEDRAEIRSDLLLNCLVTLGRLDAPEQLATPEPEEEIPEPTETPAPEETPEAEEPTATPEPSATPEPTGSVFEDIDEDIDLDEEEST